jgi:hypothetical protein
MAAPEGQIQPVKGHQGSEQKGKRPDGKGRSRQFGRGGQPFKKPDPDAVPMLKFGPANNLMRFKEALLKKALEKYGRLGKLINMGEVGRLGGAGSNVARLSTYPTRWRRQITWKL